MFSKDDEMDSPDLGTSGEDVSESGDKADVEAAGRLSVKVLSPAFGQVFPEGVMTVPQEIRHTVDIWTL